MNLSLERRAADQILLAIEQYDLDGDVAARNDAHRRCLRRARDRVAQRDVLGLREQKSFRRVLAVLMRVQRSTEPPAVAANPASVAKSTSPRLE